MALKNLSVEEMVQVSLAWVNPENPAHQSFTSVARLRGFLEDLKQAHAGLVAIAPTPPDPRQAELARLASAEDALHDLLARGIYGCLTELALLDEDGSELLELRDRLMPDGLGAATQTSYRGQAGFAVLLRQRLTAENRDLLGSIRLREGSLLDRVEAWLAAGDRLGALEEERGRLDQAQAPSPAQQTVTARNRWIRVVNALLSVAALAEVDAETERVLFGPLRDAEAKAELRAARRAPAGLPQELVGSGDG